MKTFHPEERPNHGREQSGYVMAEYVVVSLGLLLTLVVAADAVQLLLEHHQRASAVMQLPL